ncbi:MAG: T9SS type A sorting domain-containing protein [Flavobacteriaceae bacterium]
MDALLQRLASIGSQAGNLSEFFTLEEQTILRNHFAGREMMPNENQGTYVAGTTSFVGNSHGSPVVNGAPGSKTAAQNGDATRMPVVITHNVSQTITPGDEIACADGISFRDNNIFRAFDLAGDFGITNGFDVTDVEIAIGPVSTPGGFPMTLRIWESTGAAFPNGTLNMVAETTITITNADAESIISVPLVASVAAGAEMIYEAEIVDDGTATNFMRFGCNTLGQTGPSWILAPDCGATTISDLFVLAGLPNAFIMNVIGDEAGGGGGGTPITYGWESQGLGYGSFDLNTPTSYTTISPGSGTANFESSGAIDPNDLTTGYAMDNGGNIWSVDVASGAYTFLGNVGVNDAVGLEFNPVDGQLYMNTLTQLFTVDTATPSVTLVGNLGTTGALAIALGIDDTGTGYTYDIVDDSFYSVNLATGAATLIGSIGFDANFGQGMTWDANTSTMYMACFNNGIFDAEIRTVDLATGNTTLIGEFLPGNLNQLAWISMGETGGGGGGGCGDFNYANVSPTGNGVPSQTFPDFPDFDSQAVDDVVLPGPDAGTICSIAITGTGAGIPASTNNTVDLTIYEDNGGIPGAVFYTESFPSSVDADGNGSFTLEPTSDVTLNPNTTYWVQVVANMEFGVSGQWFWSSADDGNDAAALWQNPGGGFGTCTTWGTFAGCAVGGGLGPDLLMDIEFISSPIITYDTCEGALPISCGDTVQGDTLSATVDAVDDCTAGTPDAPGVWYKWEDTSGLEADVLLSTCSANTDYDTQISVFTGPDCNNLTCVAGNDDSPNCTNFQSEVEFQSDGNSTYYILVYGFNTGVGNFELSMSCTLIPPDNDMIVNAIDVDMFDCPYTDFDVAMPAATTENGTPTDCDISGANGVWYKFTPAGDGEIFCTIASPAGTYSVTFYTAPDENSSEDQLTLVDYWNNQCVEGQAEASIPYVAGQTYYTFVLNTGGRTDIQFTGCENLGVAGNVIEGFSFAPNPANDRLNLSSVDNIENVALYNILGQKVIDVNVNATSTELNVSNLSVGAYIMKVTSNGQIGTYKVIKK